MAPNRKFGRFIGAIFLLLSFLGWLRFEQALVFWKPLAQLGAWPGPLYIALGGALWGAVGLIAAWGVWHSTRWAPAAGWAAAWLYPLTYWADRLWFSPGAGPFTSWPFALGVTAVWLVLAYAGLHRSAVQ
jgi:hypothetical protein